MSSAQRGFTLLEVTVGVAVSIAVLSIAMGLFVQVAFAGKRARTKAELAREALFVEETLGRDLRVAGLGVPRGTKAFGGAADVFRAPLVRIDANEVELLADMPLPDASHATFGFLRGRPTGSRTLLAWDDENTRFFFPGEAPCTADPEARTCAWGGKRAAAGAHLVIAAGDGAWDPVQVAQPRAMGAEIFDPATGVGGQPGLRLHATAASTWPMDSFAAMPFSALGQPWVASIDRVYWRFDAGTKRLLRRQCSGRADPADAAWAASSSADPAAVPGTRCTREETMARDVSATTFAYFDEAGAATTDPARVRRVDWRTAMQRVVHGRTVRHDVSGTVDLRGFD